MAIIAKPTSHRSIRRKKCLLGMFFMEATFQDLDSHTTTMTASLPFMGNRKPSVFERASRLALREIESILHSLNGHAE